MRLKDIADEIAGVADRLWAATSASTYLGRDTVATCQGIESAVDDLLDLALKLRQADAAKHDDQTIDMFTHDSYGKLCAADAEETTP